MTINKASQAIHPTTGDQLVNESPIALSATGEIFTDSDFVGDDLCC